MMMTMQHKQDSVCICMSSLLLCRAPHTRSAFAIAYLSSAQSLNRVYLKSCCEQEHEWRWNRTSRD